MTKAHQRPRNVILIAAQTSKVQNIFHSITTDLIIGKRFQFYLSTH